MCLNRLARKTYECDIMLVFLLQTTKHKEAAVNHISLESQDEAVKQLFLDLPVDAHGAVVELNGEAVACVMPVGVAAKANGPWTESKNSRRCDLLDKEIDASLTP